MPLYDGKPNVYAVNIISIENIDKQIERQICTIPPLRAKKILAYKKIKDKHLSFAASILLCAVLGKDAAFAITEDSLGKPFIKDGPCFSLSHSGDWALLAVSQDSVGADIERCKAGRNIQGLVQRMHIKEQETALHCPSDFYKLWVLKESYVKMLGTGFQTALDSFCMRINENDAFVETDNSVQLRLYTELSGYSAAVCSKAGTEWPKHIQIPVLTFS
jgi:4'-phosphopantetheinyl transferase